VAPNVASEDELLSHLCETAPGIRLRLHSTDRLFDELDADRLDLGIAFGPLTEGRAHHKRRRIGADTFLRMFNADGRRLAADFSRRVRAAAAVLTSPRRG
jgi:DNA-binding transcriptional LysR family regulator